MPSVTQLRPLNFIYQGRFAVFSYVGITLPFCAPLLLVVLIEECYAGHIVEVFLQPGYVELRLMSLHLYRIKYFLIQRLWDSLRGLNALNYSLQVFQKKCQKFYLFSSVPLKFTGKACAMRGRCTEKMHSIVSL